MLSALTLDDADGSPVALLDDKKEIVNTIGLVGIAPVRTSHRPRPTAHGGIDESQWEDGKVVVIEGEVWSSVSIEDAFAEFREITAAASQTLTAPALIKWTEGIAGLQLQRSVKLASEIDPTLSGAGAWLNYQAQFYSPDPRAFSQTLTTATGAALSAASGGKTYPKTYNRTYTPSGGGSASCTNAGNRATPVIFNVYGNAVNPTILLEGEDQRIVLEGTVAAGDYLEIDTQARSVKLNGLTSRNNFINSAETDWFELPGTSSSNPTGTSTVRLLAESFDGTGRCDAVFRSAYS